MRNVSHSSKNFNQPETKEENVSEEEDKNQKPEDESKIRDPRDRSRKIPVEISIKYMESEGTWLQKIQILFVSKFISFSNNRKNSTTFSYFISAYKTTYGTKPVWKPYRRNFKGARKFDDTRRTCIVRFKNTTKS